MNATKVDPSWMELSASPLIKLRVERALFEGASHPHFFVHFQATNVTPKRLAIDLRDKWLPIHPNQWGFSSTEQRQVIDETRMTRPPFDEVAQKEIIAAFHSGSLQMLNPNESIDIYVEFNASGRRDVEAQAKGSPYLFVSLDGELVATDGTSIERFSVIETFDTKMSDLVIPTPLA